MDVTGEDYADSPVQAVSPKRDPERVAPAKANPPSVQQPKREPRQAELFASFKVSPGFFIRSEQARSGGRSAFGISSGDILLHGYSNGVFDPEQFDQSKAGFGGFWLTKPRRDVKGLDEFMEFIDAFDVPDVAKIKVAFDNPLILSDDVYTLMPLLQAVGVFKNAGVKGVDEYIQSVPRFQIGDLKGSKVHADQDNHLWRWFDYFFPLISEQFDSCLCAEAGVPDLCIFRPDSRTEIVGWIKKDDERIDLEYGKEEVTKPDRSHVKLKGHDSMVGDVVVSLDYSGGNTFTYTFDMGGGTSPTVIDLPVQEWGERYKKMLKHGFVEVSSGLAALNSRSKKLLSSRRSSISNRFFSGRK
jgi:hypothetical protein